MTPLASRDDIVALATMPLSRPGETTVPVRMQTEHLVAVERDLQERGVPLDIVEKYFLGLHRCDELPRDLWVGMVTDAYNLAVRSSEAPTYVGVAALEWASRDRLMRWVNAAPDGTMSDAEMIEEYLGEVNPFPDDMHVEVLERDDTGTWSPATIVERTAADEWTVELEDGDHVWRDHTELRPVRPSAHPE